MKIVERIFLKMKNNDEKEFGFIDFSVGDIYSNIFRKGSDLC